MKYYPVIWGLNHEIRIPINQPVSWFKYPRYFSWLIRGNSEFPNKWICERKVDDLHRDITRPHFPKEVVYRTQMGPLVLNGVWAFFWRAQTVKIEGPKQVPGIYIYIYIYLIGEEESSKMTQHFRTFWGG